MKQLLSLLLIIIIGACSNKKKEAMNATSSSNLAADEIELSDQQIQLGNILTDTIRNGTVDNQLLLTATLNFDQTKITAISSRVMGRIEKLYFKNIGDYVHKGAPLFDLYSEELNNAKQEYLLALERKSDLENSIIDFSQLVQSANNKLKLSGMFDSGFITLLGEHVNCGGFARAGPACNNIPVSRSSTFRFYFLIHRSFY